MAVLSLLLVGVKTGLGNQGLLLGFGKGFGVRGCGCNCLILGCMVMRACAMFEILVGSLHVHMESGKC